MSSTQTIVSRCLSRPDGVSISDLLVLQPGIPRRSLQRQIAKLLADGLIRAVGQGRARRYVAGPPSVREPRPSSTEGGFPRHIPLSADSVDILAYVEQPLAARRRVGYQRDFLETYRPNETHYLSASLRGQLHKIGTTSAQDAPAGTYSRAILNRLLIDLSWASSHLEGNTYSRLDTRELIEHGRAATGKAVLETQMILNHKTAIELLVDNVDTAEFNRYTVLNLHTALSENLLPNPADEGRIRLHAVNIANSSYSPLSTLHPIDEAFDVVLAKANAIQDPFEQSFFILMHVPYLQPFANMNKRTSRLAANIPLFRANLCPLTFLDVPERAYSRATLGVYEMTRVEMLRDLYVSAYERSTQEYLAITQELTEPDPLRLAWRDGIKATIREIILNPALEPLTHIEAAVEARIPSAEREPVQALIVEELRRIHEGVLARYHLRPSQYAAWKSLHGN